MAGVAIGGLFRISQTRFNLDPAVGRLPSWAITQVRFFYRPLGEYATAHECAAAGARFI